MHIYDRKKQTTTCSYYLTSSAVNCGMPGAACATSLATWVSFFMGVLGGNREGGTRAR